MSSPSDRRGRKRLSTRQSISDAATRLFATRGFDQVTIDEIAEAADVSRMTVFNHFPRKEDMFFDLDAMGREDLREVFRQRGHNPEVTPIEAVRLFAHRAVAARRPYTRFIPGSERFFTTVASSEALKARARSIRDELTETLASELAATVGLQPPDPKANLAAAMIVATWAVAFVEAHRVFGQSHDGEKAQATLLAIIDQGSTGVAAALAGSPYAG